MTAKNIEDDLIFTAEHLLVLSIDLIIQSAEKCKDCGSPYLIHLYQHILTPSGQHRKNRLYRHIGYDEINEKAC